MDGIDLRIVLVGGLVGALLGALYHARGRLAALAAPAGAVGPPSPATRERRRREVEPLVARAARAMAAYAHIVDAANAGALGELRRLHARLAEDDAPLDPAELRLGDRAVVEAARAFLELDAEIRATIEKRLAADQAAQVGGELRLRAAALAHAIEAVNAAAARYVEAGR